ncbi:MAG: peptidylprolyl isomerase [Bacteroidaceae bacterium]
MKIQMIVLIALLLLSGGSLCAQDNVIDEVVWVVGDEAILKSEVEEERLRAQYEGYKFDGDPYCVIPEQLAIQKLFLHQAVIDSVEVSDSEVIQQVESTISNYIRSVGTKEKLEEYFGKSMTQIREAMRENVREGMTVQRMREQLAGDIKVTPAEVRQYFSRLPEDSVPFIPTQVEVQIITLEPKIPAEEIERVKAQLREYTERINSGEAQFSTLALLYSEDPGSARRGGELDFMGRGQLMPEFANVAFNLTDPKKVSKIVQTDYGYHIIQLIEKRGDRVNCRHILLKPKIADEDRQVALSRLDSIADDIRNEKFTFDQAATYISQDKDTRNNHGLMPNPYDGTSKFEMQQLPQDVAKAVDQLHVGEISRPFVYTNESNGKEVCAIVRLRSKVNGHKANIRDDYQQLKEMYINKLKEEKLEKWIIEKQKTTYVRINENWKNCSFKYSGWVK